MNSFKSNKFILFTIVFFLILIPFFWFKPGEMDLGGDSGRLYFYDPFFLLKNISIYAVAPFGIGNIESNTYNIPFLILTSFIKSIFHSPYVVISLFNSLKLSIGFLAVYAFIKELLDVKYPKNKITMELSSIIGALFYISSPMFIGNFDRALSNHNQVFLNPLMLLLLLKFLISKKIFYIVIFFIISLTFSENFAWVSAPPIFAFYPLGIIFIFTYVLFIRKIKVELKNILSCFFAFVLLHSFHLIPSFANLFQGGSSINSRFLNSSMDYFYGLLTVTKVSENFLLPPHINDLSFIAPIFFVLIIGFILREEYSKILSVLSLIFRDFIVGWIFIFSFFYSKLSKTYKLLIRKITKFSKFFCFNQPKISNKYLLIFLLILVFITTIIGLYFLIGSIKDYKNFLLSVQINNLLFVPISLILIIGLLLRQKSNKSLPLTGLFFLLTFYLLSAKISETGVKLYESFFLYIPGFSMFRNFMGQWQFVFYFFLSLFFGQSFFFILLKLSKKKSLILSSFLGFFFFINSLPFINGSLINKVHFQSNGIKYAFSMDPKYEKTLSFIKSLADDSKILTLPFTDCCYQVIHGLNNGAYIGLSTISYLTGKKDFTGYSIIAPFSEVFLKLTKEKDYESIKRLLGILNIKYIFYNSDPGIYGNAFPSYPYNYMLKYFPNDQEGYKNFVEKLMSDNIFKAGPYGVFLLDKHYYLPHFYIASRLSPYKNYANDWYGKTESFFVGDKSEEIRTVYFEEIYCKKSFLKEACNDKFKINETPRIIFEKINPTRYRLNISAVEGNYMLVFSEAFNTNWKIFYNDKQFNNKKKSAISYFNDEIKEGLHNNVFFDSRTLETISLKPLAEDRHLLVNGYANAWYVLPEDANGRKNYELIVEMTEERNIYFGIIISILTSIILILAMLKFTITKILK